MRITRVAWGVVLGFVAPAVGAAQSVRPMFGLGIGLAVANGAYHSDENGDGFDTGWVGSMLVGFKMPKTPVFVRFMGSYSENGANEQLQGDLTNTFGRPTDAKFHNVGGTLDIGYEFGTGFRRVYIFGGGGPYHVRLSVTSGGATSDTSETKFAGTWAAGSPGTSRTWGSSSRRATYTWQRPSGFRRRPSCRFSWVCASVAIRRIAHRAPNVGSCRSGSVLCSYAGDRWPSG